MNDKKQKTEIEMCNESINWNKKEQYLKEILYLIFDYPHKHYTFKHFEI